MTLGMMMSLSYIIGQLRAPIENMIGFIHAYQDAKISLERLGEVHFQANEDQITENDITELETKDHNIRIEGLNFSYLGSKLTPVLSDINLVIPQNKVTAIVGLVGVVRQH